MLFVRFDWYHYQDNLVVFPTTPLESRFSVMSKKVIFGLVAIAIISLALYIITNFTTQTPPLDFGQVLAKAKAGEVNVIYNNQATHRLSVVLKGDPTHYRSLYPDGSLISIMMAYGIPVSKLPAISETQSDNDTNSPRGLFLLVAFVALAVLGFFYLRKRLGGAGGTARFSSPFSHARSHARIVTPQRVGITFADVAGSDEAKQELQEVVEFLRHPDKFTQLGARIPKGVLLVGLPGTGKTLLAKAVAGEANVPFLSISGSEFVEMYVGVGAARVRDLFTQAKKLAPCIIFIDEVDAVGRKRGSRAGGGSDEREQTLNQILVEMDGFDSQTNVIVVAATNRVDVLDPAFLRPGRFDRQVTVDNPDYNGRTAILKVHSRGKPLEDEVSLERIARQTAGFSGADLANLMNEAAIMSARLGKKQIGMDELEEAIDRGVAGPARTSRVVSERDKVITAYHEVGHALVAKLAGQVDPVQKISIVGRGRMGGYTRIAAQEDRSLWTKAQLESFMAFALGGHTAEELMFGEVSTGPSNDIEKVSQMARAMVCEYGMSAHFGPVRLGNMNDGQRSSNYSNVIAWQVDQEVHTLVMTALNRARQILADHHQHLVAITNYLMEHEVISGAEMDEVFDQVEAEGLGPNTVILRSYAGEVVTVINPPNYDTAAIKVAEAVAFENDSHPF